MKKNLLYILMGIAVVATFGNCEKFLTHDSPTGVSDDLWWKTEANATNALGTVYAGMPDGTKGRNVMLVSSLSDETVARQDSRGAYELYGKGLQDANWGVALTIWQDDYIDIRRACRFLENVDGCFMDSTLKARYKYEARALRAYYHMELLLYFGGIPIVTKSLPQAENLQARNTEQEVYDFIRAELLECGANLPAEYTNAEAWRVNAGACYAFLMRMAMYYRKYDVARDAAKKVIDLNVFQLYKASNPANSYTDLFGYNGELNKERIFFRDGGSSTAWTTFVPQGIGGKTVTSPTINVVNNYETKQGKSIYELGADSLAIYMKDPLYKNNRDPRMTASILFPGQKFIDNNYVLQPFLADPANQDQLGIQNSTATGFWIKKYVDAKDRNAKGGTLDFMFIRYAEVLLSYAEALIENNEWQHPDVVKYINEVRSRAQMPLVDVTVYNSQATLRKLIRRERQAELAFEGQRFFDIRRWEILDSVMNGQVYGAFNTATNTQVPVEIRSCDIQRDVRFPIPLAETLSNKNLKQNPFY
jgi:starch-binding outer membrane protein, SusD/RagB family